MANERPQIGEEFEAKVIRAEPEPTPEPVEDIPATDSKTKERVVGWSAAGACAAIGAALTKYFC